MSERHYSNARITTGTEMQWRYVGDVTITDRIATVDGTEDRQRFTVPEDEIIKIAVKLTGAAHNVSLKPARVTFTPDRNVNVDDTVDCNATVFHDGWLRTRKDDADDVIDYPPASWARVRWQV